jgi:hypothetical protein
MSLKFFRKKKNLKIITIIIGLFTIPGFIFFGISMTISNHSNKNYAATVNGQPITLQEYHKTLDRIQRKYSQMLGANYTKKISNSQMETLVLNNMIDEKILEQQAKKYNIKVSSKDIMGVIKSTPIFQNKKGQFDPIKFKEYFSNMSPEEINNIENKLKQQIMYQKLKQFIASQRNIVVNNSDLKPFITKKDTPKQIEKIRMLVLREKENQIFQKWFNKVKHNSKIKIFISIKKTSLPSDKTSRETTPLNTIKKTTKTIKNG